MHRHTFLNLLLGATAGASLTGCGAPSPSRLPSPGGSAGQPGPRPKIRAICFDLFTLFDPRSVSRVAQPILRVDAGAVCEAWRTRLFDYAWLHAAAGQYTDFRTLAVDALKFALSTRKLDLSPAQQEALVEAYSQLDPWPDTRSALAAWKLLGIALAPLANYSPVMLERLLAHSGLSDLFDAQISTASARTFKPHPNAYALGVSTLKLPREQIAFAAFGGWDAAGAKWFGFPTFWMNRLGVEQERLRPTADATGASLSELAAFVEGW